MTVDLYSGTSFLSAHGSLTVCGLGQSVHRTLSSTGRAWKVLFQQKLEGDKM